jgi:hypothetical protein
MVEIQEDGGQYLIGDLKGESWQGQASRFFCYYSKQFRSAKKLCKEFILCLKKVLKVRSFHSKIQIFCQYDYFVGLQQEFEEGRKKQQIRSEFLRPSFALLHANS